MLTTRNLLTRARACDPRALKGGRVMAEAMGVDTSRSRMVIFVIAALLACASGWLYAHMQRFVNPTPFGLHIGIGTSSWRWSAAPARVGSDRGRGRHHRAQAVAAELAAQLCSAPGRTIVFGLLMVLVLHRARDGLWPLLACWCRCARCARPIDPTPSRAAGAPADGGELILEAKEVTRKFMAAWSPTTT